MSDTTKTPAKHLVRQGKVYVEVDGNLTRNYVTIGGKRVHVHAKAGDKIDNPNAEEKAEKDQK